MYDIPEDSTLHSRNISLMGLEARPDLMSNNVVDTTIENKDDLEELYGGRNNDTTSSNASLRVSKYKKRESCEQM